MMPIIHQISGVLLILMGAVLLPLPIPLGLPMLTIGFALLAPYIPIVQRLIRAIRTKWPSANETLIKYRHKMPPVIRNTIDKTTPAEKS